MANEGFLEPKIPRETQNFPKIPEPSTSGASKIFGRFASFPLGPTPHGPIPAPFRSLFLVFDHSFGQNPDFPPCKKQRSGILKPDWRACGLALATRPPTNDGADHLTTRHFNIIAYDWILSDEWDSPEYFFAVDNTQQQN